GHVRHLPLRLILPSLKSCLNFYPTSRALNIIFTIYMIKDLTTAILNQEYFAAVNSILSIAILVVIMTISLPVFKFPAKK
ncbi:hypothetical protein D3B28_14150, partial [Listeria monocytogenes]